MSTLVYNFYAWCVLWLGSALAFFCALPFMPFRMTHQLDAVMSVWAKTTLKLLNIKVELEQPIEGVASPIVIANHQSLFDIAVMAALWPRPVVWAAKQELAWIPFVGWYLWGARHIFVKRKSPTFLKKLPELVGDRVDRGLSVLFFPEGTRSRDGQIANFKTGPFMVAQQLGLTIQPLVLQGTFECVAKGKMQVKAGPKTVRARLLEPIVLGADVKQIRKVAEETTALFRESFAEMAKL